MLTKTRILRAAGVTWTGNNQLCGLQSACR